MMMSNVVVFMKSLEGELCQTKFNCTLSQSRGICVD